MSKIKVGIRHLTVEDTKKQTEVFQVDNTADQIEAITGTLSANIKVLQKDKKITFAAASILDAFQIATLYGFTKEELMVEMARIVRTEGTHKGDYFVMEEKAKPSTKKKA